MAGIQVVFQALLNENLIVELFGLPNEKIINRLSKCNITHLSATPTFYRLLDSKNEVFKSVKRITLGGEKSDKITIDKIKKIFPEAGMTNIYATTEFGTLFISDGESFSIKSTIVDKVKFDDNTLLVHQSLLGENYTDSEWYNTGDKINVVSDDPFRFKFIGRESSIINIGGYNVFPKEIEDIILNIEGVKLVRVYAKKNSVIGNMLIAEVIKKSDSNLTEKLIINNLKEKLQAHKIPRIIKFVATISLTRSGKVKQ